jgi:hypothetical protein
MANYIKIRKCDAEGKPFIMDNNRIHTFTKARANIGMESKIWREYYRQTSARRRSELNFFIFQQWHNFGLKPTLK